VLSPPLGTSTVVGSGETVSKTTGPFSSVFFSNQSQIRFVVALEVSEEATIDWVVELWYGHKGEAWKSAAFTATSANELTVAKKLPAITAFPH
jgi:hypothetical protein